jgi:hypothetical protein
VNEFSAQFIHTLRNCENSVVQRLADQAFEVADAMRIDGKCPGGHEFCITTVSGNEVTIGFGKHWHTHIHDTSADLPGEKPFANVIRFLGRLVSEEIMIVEAYDNETYVGGRTQVRGEKRREVKRANRYVTRSWTGRYNGDSSAV